MSVMRSRSEPPILSVPAALRSVSWPHEYDLMSSSDGSWISCFHRGDALELGMVSGYWRERHFRSWSFVGGSCGDICGGGSGGASGALGTSWAVGVGGGVGGLHELVSCGGRWH